MFLDTVKEPVLVVGNGPVTAEVDLSRYATVIRFNNYPLSEPKPSHWVVAGGWKYIERRPFSSAFVPWSRHCPASSYRKDFQQRTGIGLEFTKDNEHIQRWFPNVFDRQENFPSTGFCLLAYLYAHGIRADAVGFDGMKKTREGAMYHHTHHITAETEWRLIRNVLAIYKGDTEEMMTAQQWTDSLKTPVLVVGNGPMASFSENEYGSVIRLNNFELARGAGCRVTHWASSGYKDIELRPLPEVLIPWGEHYRAARFSHQFAARIKRRVLFTPNSDHVHYWFPLAGTGHRRAPSTGFCLLAWLWSRGVYPDVVGFNGLTAGHYWNPEHQHTHFETGETEYTIIQKQLEAHRNGTQYLLKQTYQSGRPAPSRAARPPKDDTSDGALEGMVGRGEVVHTPTHRRGDEVTPVGSSSDDEAGCPAIDRRGDCTDSL